MPQLDLYLLTTFVWSILIFFTVLYFINIVYVNLNLYLVLNLRHLKYIVDKIFMSFTIIEYKQFKHGKMLNLFILLNKNNILNIKKKIIKKKFINIYSYTCKLYNNYNRNNNVNLFTKFNIELDRIFK